jgi:hypothetical protein
MRTTISTTVITNVSSTYVDPQAIRPDLGR